MLPVQLEALEVLSAMSRNYFETMMLLHLNLIVRALAMSLAYQNEEVALYAGRAVVFIGEAVGKVGEAAGNLDPQTSTLQLKFSLLCRNLAVSRLLAHAAQLLLGLAVSERQSRCESGGLRLSGQHL